jgi:ferredoxin
MRIIVDLDLCDAHGDCVVEAPQVFDLGEEDEVVTLLDPEPGEDMRAKIERAARACPVSAIRIEG